MKYQLLRQDGDCTEAAATADSDSDFAATEWARAWLQSHADHDRYVLRQEGDERSTLMIRTVAGQWYAMPLISSEGGEAQPS